jgi:thioredoxin-dependent peroxiredoxin
MIKPGERLTADFRVKIVSGGTSKEIAFSELFTRPTIVSVYMKNNTPSCDRQVDSLVPHAAEFDRFGYNLVGLSRDTCGGHVRYSAKKNVPFTLVSDPDDLFANAVGSVMEKSMYGRTFFGPSRSAFIFDRDGTVLAVIEKVDTNNHFAQLMQVIGSL